MSDKIYKIYDFLSNSEPKDFTIPPFDTNYDIIGLYKDRMFNKGELEKVYYYGSYNPMTQEFSNLVICERRTYYRVNEMVNRREMEIDWILEDDTTGSTKSTVKYYTPEESIVAGERRRSKIIASVKTAVVGLLMATEALSQNDANAKGKPFLSTYSDEITQYISGHEEPILTVVATSTSFYWLDNNIDQNGTKIRDYIYNQLYIDYTVNNITV